ncbi:MAG: hypothetical protein AAGH99_15750 [Planctomycetota bacterium]
MLWLGFAESHPPDPRNSPGSSEPQEGKASDDGSPPSLFTDAADDEWLEASDLDAIDQSMQRAGGLDAASANDGDDSAPRTPGEPGTPEDAVDPAAAEASLAFVEAHGGEAPPVAERKPESPLVKAVPWAISLAAHAALIVVAVFVVWSVRQVLSDDEIVVPLVSLSDNPGTPLEIETVQRLETQTPTQAAPPAPDPTPLEVDLALDLELPGLGEPLAAEAPSFEVSPQDAAPFETNFFGSGGNAKNIVFVLEADGSIISDYPEIVDELAKSLRDMSEKQRFSVVVFDGKGTKEPPPRGMKRATADAKAQTLKWLRPASGNIVNAGSGDVIDALNRAFRYKPELIFLLSQNLYGRPGTVYENNRADILTAVDRGLRNRTVINTIQFNDVADRAGLIDPTTGQRRPSLMAEIAQRSGGEYLTVTTNALPAE